jgi:hypothetical protein
MAHPRHNTRKPERTNYHSATDYGHKADFGGHLEKVRIHHDATNYKAVSIALAIMGALFAAAAIVHTLTF